MNRLEVEPLSDARWARIEQSLMDRLEELPQPRESAAPARTPGKRLAPRALALASAAAFAMVAAVALFVAKPWASFHESTSRVATEASPSHVTIGEASIDLSPETGIVVHEEEHATVLVLERGEVALHVSPRPKDRPFLVEAGEVHVRVVGTEFSVRRAGVSAVVTVRRGVVEVTAHGELARLKAGDAWPDTTSALLAEPPAAAAVAAPINVAPPPPSPPAVPWSPTGATRTNPTGARAFTTTRAPATRAPGGTTATAAAHPASGLASAPASAPAAQPVDSPVPEAPAAAPASPPPASPPPASTEPSAQQRYEAAEQIERKDPDGALRAYLALARGDDAWAQDALFAAGRLQADRGAHADATRLLEEYLRRFPRGSNAQDARTLRDSLR